MDSKRIKIDYNISSVDFYNIIKKLEGKKDSDKIRKLIDIIDNEKTNDKKYIDESDNNESKGARDNEYNHVVNWFYAKEDSNSEGYVLRNGEARIIYGGIGTPEMIIRLAELVGVEEELIDRAIKLIIKDYHDGFTKKTICGNCRSLLTWKMIVDSLNKKLSKQ